jgi:hypothetical protein
MAGFAGLSALLVLQRSTPQPPRFAPTDDLQVFEKQTLTQPLQLVNGDRWDDKVAYEVLEGPPGATIDARTGVFSWTPSVGSKASRHQVTVRVEVRDDPEASDEVTFSVSSIQRNRKPTLQLPADLTVTVGETLRTELEAHDPDQPPSPVRFSLVQSPPGAQLDEATGQLSWTPSAETPAGTVLFSVRVEEADGSGLSATGRFRVTVHVPEQPIDAVVDAFGAQGLPARAESGDFEHSFAGTPGVLRVRGETIRFFQYGSDDATRVDVLKIAKGRTALQMPSLPDSWVGPTRYFRKGRLLLVYAGLDEKLVESLVEVVGQPLERSRTQRVSNIPSLTVPVPDESSENGTAPGEFSSAELVQLAAWHKNGQLFRERNYQAIRNIFADRFERDYAEVIKQAVDPGFRQWLEEHSEIKAELFTAIDPSVDQVEQCLQIFETLQQEFPDQIESYANLAIALAVTWDNQRAITAHVGPMRQGEATPPEDPATTEQSFSYFVQNASRMQGRAQWLPWEFLAHVINHTTPLVERQWALRNYGNQRVMYGSIYKTVPYDTEMLKSKGQVGRIHGQTYTLPNILRFGGVCAHQADFAARVGKSLGVPAAYVSGESTYGEHHAWVMWVELKSVTRQNIGFTLESFGRYRGDKYYVGKLRDPQSGKTITDRQLELKLHTVGVSPTTQRQAGWVMQVFEPLKDRESFTIVQQFLYLRDTLELCAGNVAAWTALSKMASQPEVQEKHRQDMNQVQDLLFATFARFPDFTWTIFDDLISVHKSPDRRIDLYGQLVALYEVQGRPDLACEARLKLADMLVENAQSEEAIKGLAFSIKKFASEGRYVPRMLDKLESICLEAKLASTEMVPFYREFLPLVPKRRGSRPSKYCMRMYERGITRFQEAGEVALAQLYVAQLQQLRGESSN